MRLSRHRGGDLTSTLVIQMRHQQVRYLAFAPRVRLMCTNRHFTSPRIQVHRVPLQS